MADVYYFVSDGYLYREVENDGPTFLRRGAEKYTECLGTVEEAQSKYPEKLERAMRGVKNAVH